MTELEKMKLGEWYDANFDKELLDLRLEAQDLCRQYSITSLYDVDKKNDILIKLFGYLPDGLTIIPSFMCDYGKNIHLGKDIFINAHCYLMDGANITIGNNVFIGPYTGFYTSTHPLD